VSGNKRAERLWIAGRGGRLPWTRSTYLGRPLRDSDLEGAHQHPVL